MALSDNKVLIDEKHLMLTNKSSEIHPMGLEYAFVSPNGEACNQWIICKDFLSDIIWGLLSGNDVNIYGFTWNRRDNPIPDMHAIRLIVRNRRVSAKKFRKQMEGLVDFINEIEKEMGVSQSILCPVDIKKDTLYYIQSGIRWLRHPALFSLYLLLIRTGCVHTVGESWRKTVKKFLTMKPTTIAAEGMTQNDVSYLKQAFKLIEPIIVCGGQCFPPGHKNGWRIGENAKATIGIVHASSGIVAMSKEGYSFPVRSAKNTLGLGITISKEDNKIVSIKV